MKNTEYDEVKRIMADLGSQYTLCYNHKRKRDNWEVENWHEPKMRINAATPLEALRKAKMVADAYRAAMDGGTTP